jgi:hypothetical protein
MASMDGNDGTEVSSERVICLHLKCCNSLFSVFKVEDKVNVKYL